jgi:TldD protein
MDISVDYLKGLIDLKGKYTEIRYHSRILKEVRFTNGRQEITRAIVKAGVGIRVLNYDGCWGFSSTSMLDRESLVKTLDNAVRAADALAYSKHNRVKGLADARLAVGVFEYNNVKSIDMKDIIELVRDAEKEARRVDRMIRSASCFYREIIDNKIIVTSDGASAVIKDSKPEFVVTAIAAKGSKRVSASEGIGITGNHDDLFKHNSASDLARNAARKALRLLDARVPKGERTTIILDPAMVGLLAHEAIGHLVEADFVLSGSIARDMLGKEVASKIVTLVDSGTSDIVENAAGTTLVDDEGVLARRVKIIDSGILSEYLHNRESAYIFNVEPTGNARAFEYDDEPLIRMRNTYIEPRDYTLDEMIKEVKHGYLLKGARNGQADANGEFMFGAQEAYLIEHGEVKEPLRGVSVSGITMDVLKSIDAISKDFKYDIGTGYCGKYQPMKVDGGGAYVRCIATIGGIQYE